MKLVSSASFRFKSQSLLVMVSDDQLHFFREGTPVRTERLVKGTEETRGRDADGVRGDTTAVTVGWHEPAVTPGLARAGHRAERSAHLRSLSLQTSSSSLQSQPTQEPCTW